MTNSKQFRGPTADGRMMYPITERPTGFHAWVSDVEEIRGAGGLRGPLFLIVAPDVTSVEYSTLSSQRPGAVIEYVRTSQNEHFPATLTPKEWATFESSLGYDDDQEPMAARMYRATREEPTYRTETLNLADYTDFPVDLLAAESIEDGDPTFTWEVAAPHLVFGVAYSNAVAGSLVNLRERLAHEVDTALPGVKVWTHKARDGSISGHIDLSYEDKRTFPVKNGRKTTQVRASKSFPFDIPIPNIIVGTSKAAAIEKYNTLRDSIIDQISTSHAVVCSHCSGEGVILG